MSVQGADLEGMTRLKATFERQAGGLGTISAAASSGVSALQQLWVGPDASQFRAQWDTVHRRSLAAAAAALGEAAAIIDRNRRAQESASSAAGAGFGPGGGSPSAPTVPVQGGGAAPPTGPVPTARPVGDVFTEDYMNDFIGSHNQGENSPELNSRLEAVWADDGSDPAGLQADLDRIADIRGVDRETFRSQYATYQELLASDASLDNGRPPIDLDRHGDFLGSTASLRYGSVVGDVYGIDPVFGALLNPTGGLVGGGDNAYQPGDNDAVGYHGIFHDAAGYLLNHQQVGPGYDYLDREATSTMDPHTGQIGGISWWVGNHPELDADLSQVGALTGQDPNLGVVAAANTLHYSGVEEVLGEGLTLIEGGADIGQGLADLHRHDPSGFGQVATGTSNIVIGTADNYLDLTAKPTELGMDIGRAVADAAPDVLDHVGDHVADLGRPFAPLSGLLG